MNLDRRTQPPELLRAIALPAVLRLWGATPDPQDRHKWHTTQGVLSVNGAKFMNWNQGEGGGGAIDLVMHLKRCAFRDALDWLAAHFPAPPPPPDRNAVTSPLRLPPPDPAQLARVRHYLLHQRCLRPKLIDGLIQTGSLYADHRANAVFLLQGAEASPVGAELRGTTSQAWRGMAPGSKKDFGFFSIPPVPFPPQTDPTPLALLLCESAIDAMSAHLLQPDLACLSTAGARPNPRWLEPFLAQGRTVYCGFDTDATGQTMAQAMISLHPAVQRCAPPGHDWNDVLCSQPNY
jgi:hypothetical protein